MRKLLFMLSFILSFNGLLAQMFDQESTPIYLGDNNLGASNLSPDYFQADNGITYFVGVRPNSNNINDGALYQTDGTLAGTFPVDPAGSASIVPVFLNPTSSDIQNFAVFKDKVYYAVRLSASEFELGIYDITTGAVSIVNLRPSGSSLPAQFLATDDFLYFTAEGVNTPGVQLYATDGNTITEIAPTGSGSTSARRNGSAYVFTKNDGSKIYVASQFLTTNGVFREELFMGDGFNIPVQITDINTSGGASPAAFKQIDNYLYFSARDTNEDFEVHRIDLENNGSVELVSDLTFSGANPGLFAQLGNELFYSARRSSNLRLLYKTDLSSGITSEVNFPTSGNGLITSPRDLTLYNNEIFFSASTNNSLGRELYKIDAGGNAVLVNDLNLGMNGSDISGITLFTDRLYFNALQDDAIGNELYEYKSSNDLVRLVSDINTTANTGSDPLFFPTGTGLFISANTATSGRELYTLTFEDECNAPEAPTVVSESTNGITVTWPATPNNTGIYRITTMLSGENPNFDTPVSTEVEGQNGSFIIGLTPGVEYDIYVRSDCSLGTSDFSPRLRITKADCLTPQNVSISNITGTGATVTWDATADNDSGYNVLIMAQGDDPTMDTPVQSSLVSSGTSTDTIGLEADTTYDVYVSSICAGGDSPFSTVVSFTTLACTVVSDISIQNVTTDSFDILWVGTTDNEGTYQVLIMGDGADPSMDTPIRDFITTGTATSITGLNADTAYDVYIVSQCDGVDSGFSEVTEVTTAACTTPVNVEVSEISSDSVVVNWTGPEGDAVDFEIVLMATGDDPNTDTPIQTGLTDETMFAFSSLEIETEYDVYVKALCNGADTEFSDVLSFTTSSLSLNDFSSNGTARIYPNPVSDFFSIETSNFNVKEVTVYTLNGSKIKRFTKEENYNIQDLSSGIYIIQIISENDNAQVMKLIKV
ncbi:T9SS C-terminal target domain-containing protein [Dokdonia sinensis]|uniref:T9SS C-terminal target domain-containing protein n=1 Tax=Dokdonia sinensis TaxID=2479847 RepID=A0A3M0FWU4_9FLAO|nr:fibronectin type III domain-containing protein [Dokdonia sinensis]RMB57141.1 T9SS C-terminal target domain-containing protein [Dokdonia sinensis]